jgi:hypothetical protein
MTAQQARYTLEEAKAIVPHLTADEEQITTTKWLLRFLCEFGIPLDSFIPLRPWGEVSWIAYRNKNQEVVGLARIRREPRSEFFFCPVIKATLYLSPPNDRAGGYTEFTPEEAAVILGW